MTMRDAATRSDRQVVFSPSAWEPRLGSSRGVRVGNQIFIAGTCAADAAGQVQGADVYSQADFIIRKIQHTLRELGGDLDDVVSTVTYLADFAYFDDYARAHLQFFGDIRPVTTTVQATLVLPEFLVEITATAVLGT